MWTKEISLKDPIIRKREGCKWKQKIWWDKNSWKNSIIRKREGCKWKQKIWWDKNYTSLLIIPHVF